MYLNPENEFGTHWDLCAIKRRGNRKRIIKRRSCIFNPYLALVMDKFSY